MKTINTTFLTVDGHDVEIIKNANVSLDKETIATTSINDIIGKRVKAHTEGYSGQVYDDEFAVGSVINNHIITMDGRDTGIFSNDDGVFCCTDEDRWTLFTIID